LTGNITGGAAGTTNAITSGGLVDISSLIGNGNTFTNDTTGWFDGVLLGTSGVYVVIGTNEIWFTGPE